MPVGQDGDESLLRAVTGFDPSAKIGVAVSGGGDSMALLHLMHRAGWPIEAVTVNHGLRAEAAAEATSVARFCQSLNIPHTILHWSGPDLTGNLMDQARRARLSLMADWARGRGIEHIVLGHTADDQAETLLMGLARKAGLDGLSGMRPVWSQHGVTWSRPLLAHGRQALRAYLGSQSITWVDDPTNDDDAYTRVKARRALKPLAALGITTAALAAVVGHLESSRQALSWALATAAGGVVTERAGALRIDRHGLHDLPQDLQRRLLIAAVLWISRADYAPRDAAIQRLQQAIVAGRAATLWGCRLRCDDHAALITREPRAVVDGQPWDNRWHVTGPSGEIRALGTGLGQIKDWRATGLPRAVLEVTPAIWTGDTVIAAPLAGFGATATATVQPTFGSFLLSH